MSDSSGRRCPTVLVVEPADGARPLAAVFASRPELFETVSGDTLEQALARCRAGAVQVVVVSPDLPGAWPADVVDRLVEACDGRASIVLLCDSEADFALFRRRLATTGAAVLRRRTVSPDQLARIVLGRATEPPHHQPD